MYIYTYFIFLNFSELPAFASTGLPDYVRSSWENAAIIVSKDGVKEHPLFPNKQLVVSLTRDLCYSVVIQEDKLRYIYIYINTPVE